MYEKYRWKKYAIIGIVCNRIKLLLSGLGIFLLSNLSVILGGVFLKYFELIFTVASLALLIILLIKISNGKVFNGFNKTGKVLCIVSLILSDIIIVIRLFIIILGIIFYAKEARKYDDTAKDLERMGIDLDFVKISRNGYFLSFQVLLLLLQKLFII